MMGRSKKTKAFAKFKRTTGARLTALEARISEGWEPQPSYRSGRPAFDASTAATKPTKPTGSSLGQVSIG
jgi:hypothetical protein